MIRHVTDILIAMIFAVVLFGLSHKAQSESPAKPAPAAKNAPDHTPVPSAAATPDSDLQHAVREIRDDVRSLRREVETIRQLLESELEPNAAENAKTSKGEKSAIATGMVHPGLSDGLYFFYADWCGPCQTMRPLIERMNADGPLPFVTVDIDKRAELARKFEVKSIPTYVLVIGGKEVERLRGVQDAISLRGLLRRHLKDQYASAKASSRPAAQPSFSRMTQKSLTDTWVKVAVVCQVADKIRLNFSDIEKDLAAGLTKRLWEHKIVVVAPDALQKMLDTSSSHDETVALRAESFDPQAIAKASGATHLIVVDVNRFDLIEENSHNLIRGRADVVVGVTEVSPVGARRIYTKDLHTVNPLACPRAQSEVPYDRFRRAFTDDLSDKIGAFFYLDDRPREESITGASNGNTPVHKPADSREQQIKSALKHRSLALGQLPVAVNEAEKWIKIGVAQLEVRTYPVADLVTMPPGIAPSAVKENFEKLIALITSTVEPKSWSGSGGSGSIRRDETILSVVISQTPAVHDGVRHLLQNLRTLQSWQIVFDTAIVENPSENLLLTISAGSAKTAEKSVIPISEWQRATLLTAARRDPETKLTRINATLFFGQSWTLPSQIANNREAISIQTVDSSERYGVDLKIAGRDVVTGKPTHDPIATYVPNLKTVLIELNAGPAAGDNKKSPNRTFLILQPRLILIDEEVEQLESR